MTMQQPLDNNVVQPNRAAVDYNVARLELLVILSKLRRHLGEDQQLRGEFEMELRVLFREFARSYPNAGIGELDAVQLVLRLTTNAPGGHATAAAEFAQRLAGHPFLVAAFRSFAKHL